MISIKPGTPKKLTFSMTFRGMDLSAAKARVLIPVSESMIAVGDGRITDKNITVKIPAIENVELRKSEAVLEVITADGKYFNPYRGEVEFLEEAVIENVILKEEKEKVKEPEEKIEVAEVKQEEEPKPKVECDEVPRDKKKKDKKPTGFRRFLKDKS